MYLENDLESYQSILVILENDEEYENLEKNLKDYTIKSIQFAKELNFDYNEYKIYRPMNCDGVEIFNIDFY